MTLTSGATASWLLSEMVDPFGNTIVVNYDGATDAGTRYPLSIAYGPNGVRRIEFRYQPRTDRIYDFAGGIERVMTQRLREIRVLSYGQVFRRHVFGYAPAGTYSTERTRLAWVQQFGNDCQGPSDPLDSTSRSEVCIGLPRQEFEYTDPSDSIPAVESGQWWSDANYNPDVNAYLIPVFPNGTHAWTRQFFADVNGDGLLDEVRMGPSTRGPQGETAVYLNTGAGFAKSNEWTTALKNLPVELPRVDFTQVASNLGYYYPDVLGITSATASTQVRALKDVTFGPHERPDVSRGAPMRVESGGGAQAGHIEARGTWHLVDVDLDGRADLLMSVRLSGVTLTHAASGELLGTRSRIGGQTVAIVFRNTGSGWIRDDALAGGLPPFNEVVFDSGYVIGYEQSFVEYEHGINAWQDGQVHPCVSQGFWGYYWVRDGEIFDRDPAREEDVCFNLINLDPRFADFNGDGFVDVMVLERANKDLLWVGYRDHAFSPEPPTNFAQSRVWIQQPGQAQRWVRAPQFDLPLAAEEFPTPERHSGYWPGRRLLAHSWLQHHSDLTYGKVDGCPDNRQAPMNWCGPLVRNFDNGVRIGDLNRDGLTDIVWSLNGGNNVGLEVSEGVFLNTGSGWCASSEALAVHVEDHCPDAASYLLPAGAVFSPVQPYASSNYNPVAGLADLNGDGWLDYFTGPEDIPSAWLHSGTAVAGNSVWRGDARFDWPATGPNSWGSTNYAYADLNGDGILDTSGDSTSHPLCCIQAQADRVALSRSRHPDLLKTVRNGQGGEIQIVYESAARQRFLIADDREARAAAHSTSIGEGPTSRDVVLWTASAVVSQVRVIGPNLAGTPTTTYRYAHPRFCNETRSYLGFRLVERIRPDGSLISQYFYQRHGRAGRLSELIVESAAGSTLFDHVETWALDGDPDLPEVIPGTIAAVRNARLTSTRSAYRYGNAEGSVTARAFGYDDYYGFNFLERIDEIRPTGTVITERAPEDKDTGRWIMGLVAWQRRTTSDGTAKLSESWFDYALGRLVQRQDLDRRRDGTDPAASVRTITARFAYDDFGNLAQRTDMPDTPDVRTTVFCYDGDQMGWCTDFDQSSHSVVVGVRQFFLSQETNELVPVVQAFEPDPLSGVAVGYTSTFTDDPGLRWQLDRFSRPVFEYATPLDGDEFPRASTIYHDDASPPFREEVRYIDRAGTNNFVATAIVSDGFGGTWKKIDETPSGTFFGTATYRDPVARTSYTTYPTACGDDDLCTALTGAPGTAGSKAVTQTDPVGRLVSILTPDGLSVTTYGPASGFDRMLSKNAKGDLTEQWRDGDRVAAVTECRNSVTAAANDITSVECTGPSTAYEFEGNEIVSIRDPANHVLEYFYDTFGRARQINDPDAGTTFTTYDPYGNVAMARNARGHQNTYRYDQLDRLISAQSSGPAPGWNDGTHTVRYRDEERRRWRLSGPSYSREYFYDDMGRVARKSQFTRTPGGNQTLLLDFTYDELDRETTVTYPDTSTVLRYEYEGAYLKRMCEVTELADNCAVPAQSYISDVSYDELGRRQQIATPAGVRTFAYTPATQRLQQDRFVGPLYQRTLDYLAHDQLGNLLRVDSSNATGAALDFGATYTFDHRNRLESWQPDGGSKQYFGYDDLGNLTGHGVASVGEQNQIFDDPLHPHRLTRRSDGTVYGYDLDGNRISASGGPGAAKSYGFDSKNRLVCAQDTSGTCNTEHERYDLDGVRVASGSTWGSGIEVDDRVTWFIGGVITYRFYAFGEEFARREWTGLQARTASIWSPPGGGFPEPPGWLLALLVAGVGAGAIALVVRIRRLEWEWSWPEKTSEQWAASALASGLILVLIIPPLPARAGGGNPNWATHRWLLNDPLGTATALLADDGSLVSELVYTPFGGTHSFSGNPSYKSDLFAGHRRNYGSQLYFMQARWMDPVTGTFLSVDPVIASISDPQSLNAYSYARNNPVSFTDPTGALTFPYGFCLTIDIPGIGIETIALEMDIDFSIDSGSASFGNVDMSGIDFQGMANVQVVQGGQAPSPVQPQAPQQPALPSPGVPKASEQFGPAPWGPGYAHDTAEDAAVDGILYSRSAERGDPRGKKRERAGDIQPALGGGYYYGDVQVGPPGGLESELWRAPDAVGTFHTHTLGGDDFENRWLSRPDRRRLPKDLQHWLGGTDGAIRRFDPGGPRRGETIRPRGYAPPSR